MFSGLICNKFHLIAFLQKCKICNGVELKVKKVDKIFAQKKRTRKWNIFSLSPEKVLILLNGCLIGVQMWK